MPLLSLSLDELRTRNSLKWRTFDPDVLPMWVAEMDVAMHPVVKEVLETALTRGDTGYPYGTEYADAYAGMALHRWQWQVEADEQIRRTGDVMSSVHAVLETVTAPGDAVLINPPVYPPFRLAIAGYERRIVEAPLTTTGRLDLAGIEAAFSGPDRPTAYLLCSPHNPNGTVHTRDELIRLMELANAHQVQVIADEIHAPLVAPDTNFVPLLAVPGGETAIAITSAGKAWNLAALKGGLVIAGTQATSVLDRLPQLAREATGHLANVAHTAAIRHAQDWIDELVPEIVANKVLLAEQLASRLPELSYTPSEGTYLAWLDCTPLGLASPVRHFLEQGRVAFSPGINFGRAHGQWVRINLGCSPELVIEGVSRMAASLGR